MSPGWRFWDVEGFRNVTRLLASDLERDIALNSLGLGVKSIGVDPDFLCLGPSGSYQVTQQTFKVRHFFFFFKQSKNNTTFTIIKNKQNNNIPNLENTIYRTWKRKLNERGKNDGEQINSVKKVNTQIIHLKLTGKSTSTLQNVTTKIWKSSKLSMKPTQGATEPSPFPMSGLVSSAACACNKKKKYCKNCFFCIKNTAIYIGHFDQENISVKISETFVHFQ